MLEKKREEEEDSLAMALGYEHSGMIAKEVAEISSTFWIRPFK